MEEIQSQPQEVADKQMNVRVSEVTLEYWKRAAEAKGVSLSEFVRDAAQAVAVDTLECPHPIENRLTYPWSERCLRCGARLR